MNGKGSISLKELEGKVVIVDFWATWCGPCEKSFPKLEELNKKYAGKLEIVAVACDEEETKGTIPDFAKNHGNASFPIGWDDGHSRAKKWHVDKMPTSFILDATGKVRYIHAGYEGDKEAEEMGKELASLADEPSVKKDTKVAANDSSTAKDAAKDTKDTKDTAKDPPKETAKDGDTTDGDPPPTTTKKKPAAKKPGKKPKKKTAPAN